MLGDDLTWLTIDLRAIDKNIQSFRSLIGPEKGIVAVVKSNAYGHGLYDVALQALKSGAEYLAVANADEALTLRKKGIIKPIIVLGAVSLEELKLLIKEKVTVVAYDINNLRRIIRTAEIMNKPVTIHLKVDTGLNRLGFEPSEVPAVVKSIRKNKLVNLEGIYTHLASVEEGNRSFTKDQLLEFDRVLTKLKDAHQEIKYISAGASAAAMLMPDSHYNMIRLGISMYGMWASREAQVWARKYNRLSKVKLKPALTWKTKIIQVKKVYAGEVIGYGCTYPVKKTMTVAVIPVGYFDGYPRHLSNMGLALVKSRVVPIVGRVCMNMTMLDVSKMPNVKAGEVVTLIGQVKNKEITAQDLADWAGTINYEITTRIPSHIPRRIIK